MADPQSALSISVRSIEMFVQVVRTRMPFRYGAARLVTCPHLYLVATIADSQGRTARGIAADHLPPLWFDKSPDKSYRQQIDEQLQVIRWARDAALAEAPASPFQLWLSVYGGTQQAARAAGLPGLLGGFGPSLVERAVNDAVGHLLQMPFHRLLQSGALGVDLGVLEPQLRGVAPADLLPDEPVRQVAVRHTVGLADPILASDVPPTDRLDDGLPQSLDEVVRFYGVRYFKIKTQNRLDEDLDRLNRIAQVLDSALDKSYYCTLDGNEQYHSMEELLPLVDALETQPALARLAQSILFIEQPLARSAALEPDLCRGIGRVGERFPVIIDESDDSPEAFSRALELGYRGVSHKNCKNTFKSLLNLGRARFAQKQPIILSAEDLSNIGTIALQQDLTALSTLGITHAERNGQHYFRGLSHLSPSDQAAALAQHPELYVEQNGLVRLDVREGSLDCSGLHRSPGLAGVPWPSLESFTPADAFDPSCVDR